MENIKGMEILRHGNIKGMEILMAWKY